MELVTAISLAAARLFVAICLLFPTRDPHGLINRMVAANAIATVTDNEIEQLTLARLDGYESGFASDVGQCKRKGDGGASLGSYQVKPIERGDAKRACGTQVEQATLALAYVHRGAAACRRKLEDGPRSLFAYVSGLCAIDGQAAKMAERRWGGTPFQTLQPFAPLDTSLIDEKSAKTQTRAGDARDTVTD